MWFHSVTDQFHTASLLITSAADCLVVNIKQPMIRTANRDGVHGQIRYDIIRNSLKSLWWRLICYLWEVSKVYELIEGRCYNETGIKIFCSERLLERMSALNASWIIFLIFTIYYSINFLWNSDFFPHQHSCYYGINWIQTINQSLHYCFFLNFLPPVLADMSNFVTCQFNFQNYQTPKLTFWG
jgi:hypothetical protein